MPTTIQISDDIKQKLDKMKFFERETYNEILERMVEDNLELNDKTKKELDEARKQVKKGNFLTQEQVEKKLGL